jgi:hypothetical protein
MEASGRSGQAYLPSEIFHSLRLQEGSNGDVATTAAKHICHRLILLLEYWNFDMEANGISEKANLPAQIFHSLRSQEGSHGGGATICVGAACLAEVLILIPGCNTPFHFRICCLV